MSFSGIVKTTSKSSRFIKTCTFVKLRKGMNGSSSLDQRGGGGASNSNKNKQNSLLTASKRASQRKSSGYESSAGGVDSSERDSIDSLKGLESETKEKVIATTTNTVGVNTSKPSTSLTKKLLEPLNVIKYEESFIQKLDERWRSCEVKRLQQQQKELKVDLKEAKQRISRSEKNPSWSFNLHVADSVKNGKVKSTDPSIIEALQKETQILSKRVNAAKSHAVLTTSFDVDKSEARRLASPLTSRLLDNCCTTECDPPEDMIMENRLSSPNTSKETEIF